MSYRLYLTLRKQAPLHCIIRIISKTMWVVLFFVSCTSLLVEGFGNDEILGKGRWLVLTLLQCENPEQYDLQLDLTRRKINRTHDAFSVHGYLDRELNVSYGIEIIADKEVDGGFKFYSQLTDDSFCNMVKKYVGNNWEQLLTKANVDPPDCPLPVGEVNIDDFVIDYRELEETGMYGKYDASAYFTYMGLRVACTRLIAQFEKQREEGDDDDDDEDY